MKTIKILLITVCLMTVYSKLNKDYVEIAVNCGGDQYIDSEGILYQKDNYFDNGIESDYGLNYDITNTEDMDLYQTERWHSDTFTYSMPVKTQGKYILILKFSEVYFGNKGEKVFDIAIGKKIVIKDVDIFERVGKAAAHDEFVEFELKDDKVYINRSEVPGAYDSKSKQLKVRFVKGSKDNPKINAILLYRGDINDTEFAEKKKKQEEINKKKLQEAKKHLLIEMRHHPDDIYNEEDILSMDDSVLFKEGPSLFHIFFTINGAYIIVSFGIMILFNYLIDQVEGQYTSKRR
jgi:hypothetical protein